MKTRGIFAITAMWILAMAGKVKEAFSTVGRSTGGSGRISMGRDAFLSISAPRCHTQKPRRVR
jgi:hypothetical protein